jgi:predicted ATP-grasp superfamily ATP-dependent carboligase
VLAREHADAGVMSQVIALGASGRGLIATEDRWLELIAAHRAALEDAYDIVLAPSNETLRVCLNKAYFVRWCLEKGLPGCRSWSLDRLAEVTLPALIRPVTTLHGRGDVGLPKAIFVDSVISLDHWAARFRASGVDALISESLLGRGVTQYSVPFARRDRRIASFVARKVRPPASWAGTGTYVELCPNAEIERLAIAAVEALDFQGIGEVEILHSAQDGRSYLIEINARPWVQYSLAEASGHHLLRFLLGEDLARGATQPKKEGVRWLNFRGDLYVCFSRSEGLYAHGKLSLLEYLRGVLRANAFAFFDWRDPWPAITELAALLGELAPRALRAGWHRT